MSSNKPDYKQWEIWWVDLKPVVGNETDKRRACVVLQNDSSNRVLGTTVVAPLIPFRDEKFPTMVRVAQSNTNKLDKNRCVDLSQIRAVSYKRFTGKLGTLEAKYRKQLIEALMYVFCFDTEDP